MTKQHQPLALELEVRKVDLLYRQNLSGSATVFLNSVFYTYVSWGITPHSFLVPWFIILNLSVICRVVASFSWNKTKDSIRSTKEVTRWLRLMQGLLAVSGFSWGAVGWMYVFSPSLIQQSLTILILSCATAGSLVSYASSLQAMAAVVVPILIPWSVHLLISGVPDYALLGVVVFVYAVLALHLGLSLNKYVANSLHMYAEWRESEERLRLARDSSAAISWSWTLATGEFTCDGRLEQVFGTGIPLFQGRRADYLNLVHPDDRAGLIEQMDAAAEGNGELDTEHRLLWKDGTIHHISMRGRATVDPHGRPVRLTGICLDVTAKRTQEQTRHERDVYEAANKAKSIFLANASHEIRTPLAAINGFAETILQRPSIPDDLRHDVAIIERQGKYLTSLVSDLLDLSKIESGHFYMQKSPMSPGREIEDCLWLMKNSAAKKNIELKIVYQTLIPAQIQSDPVRFRQILINLLSNAVKYTQQGRIVVYVSFDQSPEDGQLRIAVSDTGIGMDQETIFHLFEPFVRGQTPDVQRAQGSGLGLPLARDLARMMGGELRLVSSSPGSGSTFEVSLHTGPVKTASLVRGEDLQQQTPLPPKAAVPLSERLLKDRNILVVDDAPDLRFLMKRYLERQGALVETCENGEEAVQRALQKKYSFILMDIKMPVMDGYHATTLLRDHGYQQPIIAITAHASLDDRQMCFRAGCDDYLSKPVDMNHLMDLLSRPLSH